MSWGVNEAHIILWLITVIVMLWEMSGIQCLQLILSLISVSTSGLTPPVRSIRFDLITFLVIQGRQNWSGRSSGYLTNVHADFMLPWHTYDTAAIQSETWTKYGQAPDQHKCHVVEWNTIVSSVHEVIEVQQQCFDFLTEGWNFYIHALMMSSFTADLRLCQTIAKVLPATLQ